MGFTKVRSLYLEEVNVQNRVIMFGWTLSYFTLLLDHFLPKTINHTVENAIVNHPKNRPFCVTFGKKKGFELSPNQMLQTCAEFGIS